MCLCLSQPVSTISSAFEIGCGFFGGFLGVFYCFVLFIFGGGGGCWGGFFFCLLVGFCVCISLSVRHEKLLKAITIRPYRGLVGSVVNPCFKKCEVSFLPACPCNTMDQLYVRKSQRGEIQPRIERAATTPFHGLTWHYLSTFLALVLV